MPSRLSVTKKEIRDTKLAEMERVNKALMATNKTLGADLANVIERAEYFERLAIASGACDCKQSQGNWPCKVHDWIYLEDLRKDAEIGRDSADSGQAAGVQGASHPAGGPAQGSPADAVVREREEPGSGEGDLRREREDQGTPEEAGLADRAGYGDEERSFERPDADDDGGAW